jgi:hypothetical protein
MEESSIRITVSILRLSALVIHFDVHQEPFAPLAPPHYTHLFYLKNHRLIVVAREAQKTRLAALSINFYCPEQRKLAKNRGNHPNEHCDERHP